MDKKENKLKTSCGILFISLIIFGIIIIGSISVFLFFNTNLFYSEKDVRKQIKNEQEALFKEYNPVLEYLAIYKKEHGVYPQNIDKVVQKSETFYKYEYNVRSNKKGYWLIVYPKKLPIEYYYNDEDDNGYNRYKGDGYEDGFMDNQRCYQINEKWHAIKNDISSDKNYSD